MSFVDGVLILILQGQTKALQPLLMFAIQGGHLELVHELCDRGANVNATRIDNGGTALHLASALGHLEIARLLIRKGANKSATCSDGATTAFSEASGPHKVALQALLKP